MTEKTCKVGDVVAWADVPYGAMVRVVVDDGLRLAVRGGWSGGWVFQANEWVAYAPTWAWRDRAWMADKATIVALNVPTDTTADDLRRLAEVFEVREALARWAFDDMRELDDAFTRNGVRIRPAITLLANILHAAGWRPGMTAEDAARLLEGAV